MPHQRASVSPLPNWEQDVGTSIKSPLLKIRKELASESIDSAGMQRKRSPRSLINLGRDSESVTPLDSGDAIALNHMFIRAVSQRT